MKIVYQPKNPLEKFGEKVHNLLVENFSNTYYVGGMVRDLLLGKKITDIDIATEANPHKIISTLQSKGIEYDDRAIKFGVILAKKDNLQIEIATFRKESYGGSRYPKIKYIKSPKIDSQRRDFTINSLYLSGKDNKILDFHKGVKDILQRVIVFIGQPSKKIQEDPLRILRALRFALELKFKLSKITKSAIKNNFKLTASLTKTRIQNEIAKCKSLRNKNILTTVLNEPKLLDKYFT